MSTNITITSALRSCIEILCERYACAPRNDSLSGKESVLAQTKCFRRETDNIYAKVWFLHNVCIEEKICLKIQFYERVISLLDVKYYELCLFSLISGSMIISTVAKEYLFKYN